MPNLSFTRKILIAANVLLIVSFLLNELFSFPFLDEVCEFLRCLVIPIITLMINKNEGPGKPKIINNGNKGNNNAINENANDLANEGNNQEAIPPDPANQDNQINEGYD